MKIFTRLFRNLFRLKDIFDQFSHSHSVWTALKINPLIFFSRLNIYNMLLISYKVRIHENFTCELQFSHGKFSLFKQSTFTLRMFGNYLDLFMPLRFFTVFILYG